MWKVPYCFSLIIASVVLVKWTKPENFIIGGKMADIASHPHLVSIRHRAAGLSNAYLHTCAGSIYTETAIITAAQCLDNLTQDTRIMIVAGGNVRTGMDGQLYAVKKWIAHPKWNARTVDYDIGVIILDMPLDLSHPFLSAISIRAQRPIGGKIATIAGWGYREEFGPSSHWLEEARVPIVSTADCVKAYGVGEVTDRMICAGYLSSGGVDVCQGDTGGPLVVDGELVGLVSWGRGCARPGYPSVYTFVGSLKKWIDDTIGAN